jgi:hypothetical protein
MKTFCSRILIAAFLLFLFNTTQAQNCWSSVGAGIGNFSFNFNTNFYNNQVSVMTPYNGNLIVAGTFDTVGGNIQAKDIASWNGSSWSAIGSGLTGSYVHGTPGITSMVVYNGDLYVAGYFDSIEGIAANSIAKWDGTTWSTVGTGVSGANPYLDIYAMAVYNGTLYVAGQFDSAGGVLVNNIASWNGTSWSAVANGITELSGNDEVTCLTVSNGVLYAGGVFGSASGVAVNNIAAWNGNAWAAAGNGLGSYSSTSPNSYVGALGSYQGNLYASVSLTDDPSGRPLYYISMWNGASWSDVIGGPGSGENYYGGIAAFLPFDGGLLGAGEFLPTSQDSTTGYVAMGMINGNSWSNTTASDGALLSLAIYNSHLFAGGYFSILDTTHVFNIAEYTCATDGITEITKNKISIYPNPNNGVFNLSIENAEVGSYIVIYDLMGARVYQSEIGSNKSEINLTNQAPGTYLYNISDGQGANVASGSFIVE